MSVDIQTIGVGFETAGLVKGQQALDATAAAAARTADAADRVGATASRAMESAGRSAETASRQMGGAFTTVRNVLTSMGGSGGVLAAFMGGAVGAGLIEVARSAVNAAGAMVTMADAASNMRQQLNLASGSAREAQDAYDRLLSIAQRSRVEVTALAGTYAQMARSTSDLGIGQDRLLRVTETLSKAITMSGGSAQSAQAAMVQLSQGLSAGALRGEELNSILEQTPRVARALADGLGVGVGQLRAMGEAGELTAERVIQAFEKSAGAIDREFAKTEATVSQSMTVLGNSVLDFIGELDRASGASASTAKEIMLIASALDTVTRAIKRFTSEDPIDEQIARVRDAMAGPGGLYKFNLADQLEVLSAKKMKEDEAALEKWSDGVVVAFNKAKTAAEAFANDKGNLSKLDQKVASQRKLTDEFLKVTKDFAAGSAEYVRAYAAYQQGLANINDRFTERKSGGGGPDGRRAAADLAREMEEQRRAIAEAAGVTADYIETLVRYQAALKSGALTHEQYVRAVQALIARQPGARDLLREQEEAHKLLTAAMVAEIDAMERRHNAQADAWSDATRVIAGLKEEARWLGVTNEARQRAVFLEQTRAKVAAGTLTQAQGDRAIADFENAFDALLGRQRELRGEIDGTISSASQSLMQLGPDVQRGLTDSLFRAAESGLGAFESLGVAVRGIFNNMVLRPVIQGGVNGAMSAGGSMLSSAIGSTGMSALGTIGSSFMGSLGSVSGISNGMALIEMGGGLGSAFSGGLGGAMVQQGIGQALGAVAPYLAAAVLVYQLLSKKGGGPKNGGSFSTGDERLFTPNTADALLGGLGSGLLDQVGALTGRYGGSIAGSTISLGFDQDPIGTAGSRIASRVVGADGRVILDNSAGRDVGRDQDKFEAELAIEAQRVLLAALQASNLENGFAEVFGRLDPATAAPDAVTNILALAETLYALGEAAKGLPGSMGAVANLSATARESLINMAGGLDALLSAQNTFMSEFLTEAERHTMLGERVGAEFLRVVGMPLQALTEGRNSEQIREAFKGLVLGIDMTTESGLAAYVALNQLAGPLSQWIDGAVELGQVSDTAVEATRDLQTEIDSMATTFGDLEAAMREIQPASETLVDAWRRGKAEIDKIRAALGIGGSQTGADVLISGMGRYQGMADSYGGARRSLDQQIFETGLTAMNPQQQAAALRERAAGVWSTLQGSADPGAVIATYSDLIIRAIRAEAAGSVGMQQAGFDAEYKAAVEAQRLGKEARQDQIAVLTAQRQAWEDQLDALERMADFSREIRDYVSDLRIGDLSILSPADRIAQAAQAFRANVAGAQAGDVDSQRALTASATDYLQEVRKFYASSGPYVSAFNEVTGTLDALGLSGAKPVDQATLLQQQIDEAVKQVDHLKAIDDAQIELRTATIDTSAAEIDALKAIDTAAGAAQTYLLSEVRNMRTALLEMLAQLDGIRTEQEAQIIQNANAQSQLIELTKQTAGNTGATAGAVNAAASAPAPVS